LEIRNILFRKEMKLVTLLLTSLLIASASAAVYYSLTMSSTIQVYKANVYFKAGTDNGTVSGLVVTLDSTNTTATLTGLRAYPNATFTYTDPIKVRNNATSGTTPIRLAPLSNPSNVNASHFEYIKFLLNTTNPATYRWLNYTSSGGTWTVPSASDWVTIGTSTEWSIAIYTKATAAATVGASVKIEITVDVQ